jgi:peroxiredoxin
VQLHRARDDFRAAGANIVLIGQRTPEHAAEFRRKQGLDLTVLADKKRETYALAGTKVANLGELIGPKVVARSLVATAKTGKVQTKTDGHTAQLGGTLVVAPDGRVTWSHIAHDASDNASPEEILEAVRAIG